jgi:hypothetical protein
MIHTNTSIEEIVQSGSIFVDYLSQKGIRCIRCGEPVWGTLGDAARAKGFNEEEIEFFINELNHLQTNKVLNI